MNDDPNGREVGRPRPRKTRAQRTHEAQRALEMHQAGLEDVYICAELGISRSTLRRRITYALALVVDPTVTEYRGHALGRIRALRRRTFETLGKVTSDVRTLIDTETGEPVTIMRDPGAVARLVDTLTRLEDQEAKLRGAYAPTRVDVTVTERQAWQDLDAALAAWTATAATDGDSTTPPEHP